MYHADTVPTMEQKSIVKFQNYIGHEDETRKLEADQLLSVILVQWYHEIDTKVLVEEVIPN